MKTLLLFACAWLWIEGAAGVLDAATPHPLGFRSSPHGVPGAPIETHPLFKAAPLPSSASVREYFYRTDQKDRGACVAFSGNEAVDAITQKNNNGQHAFLSFLDTYQRCLVMDGSFPNDNGTYGGTLLKVLQGGVLTEKTWPYAMPLNMLPADNPANRDERAQHITLKSYALSNRDGGYGIKQCIANLRVPALIGSLWYNNGFTAKFATCSTKDLKGNKATVKRYVLPYPKGNPVGGHEVPIVSYDDNMKFPTGEVGGVEIHNHWGAWGDERGCAWIPYKWAFSSRIVEDVVAIELVSKPSP